MKSYILINGYIINRQAFYDGYNSYYRWCVWKPNGELYRSCDSYNRAYEIAKGAKKYDEVPVKEGD